MSAVFDSPTPAAGLQLQMPGGLVGITLHDITLTYDGGTCTAAADVDGTRYTGTSTAGPEAAMMALLAARLCLHAEITEQPEDPTP